MKLSTIVPVALMGQAGCRKVKGGRCQCDGRFAKANRCK